MAKPSLRPPVSGPPLIHALTRLGEPAPTIGSPALPAMLGSWVDWNRAVALARALDGALPTADDATPADVSVLLAERDKARTAHAAAIDALMSSMQAPVPAQEIVRSHAALQRALLTSTGRLRGALRDQLARRDEAGCRLAELDAVMEQVLAPREYRTLGAVAERVAAQLDRAAAAMPVAADESPMIAPDEATIRSWPAATCAALRDLLMAELDLRFHPIDGLSAALQPN